MLLAADIGGTKTAIALFAPGDFAPQELRIYQHARFPAAKELLTTYLEESSSKGLLKAAVFSLAGPVIDGRCQMINLGWTLTEEALCQILEVSQVRLINDLVATAYGTLVIPSQDLLPLKKGHPVQQAPRGIIAAGTGLGQSVLIPLEDKGHLALATEAGHADFAPADDLEWGLYKYLHRRYGHVSVERIVSGPGIENIYRYLLEKGPTPDDPFVHQRPQARAPEIVSAANKSPTCRQALQIFLRAYGAEAGNLALRTLARGGIYLGGGIAPKIVSHLKGETFISAFLSKGRLQPLLEEIPVYLIRNEETALLGAAYLGQSLI